jgi:pimeloyl-ACP methyl ester carboxylesterase
MERAMPLEMPETRYARSGDVHIGYQVLGDAPRDLILNHGFVSNIEVFWEEPTCARFLERLAKFARVIVFDKRGTGLSDRVPVSRLPTLEQRIDDVRAVMDAVGSERAALYGYSEGGPMCALFAATYPERVNALVLHNTWPRVVSAPDYPFGQPVEEWHRRVREARLNWGTREYQKAELRRYLPSFADDPAFEQWHVMHERLAASPGAAAWFMRVLMETDIREMLPAISVPTLILYHERWKEGCAYMAERIPNAELVELTLPDVSTWTDPRVLEHLQRFLGEGRVDAAPERVLTTVLFTDIVDSTSRAAEMGDERWRELLLAHHAVVRAQLARYGGKEVRSTGDGVFATFDGPARAIVCALRTMDAVGELGLDIRAGIHTGEVELVANKVEGIAVHIGARVAAEAKPCELLVSSIVRDLAAGSSIEFEDRGVRTLKGVPGDWQLFAARLSERAGLR